MRVLPSPACASRRPVCVFPHSFHQPLVASAQPSRAVQRHAAETDAASSSDTAEAAAPSVATLEQPTPFTAPAAKEPSVPDASPVASDKPAEVAASPKQSKRSLARQKDPLPEGSFPVKVKDKVVGKVIFANARGARVALVDYPGVVGYLPKNRGPYAIRDAFARNHYVNADDEQGCIPKGLIRRFSVIAVPDNMEINGRGPLLAANNMDTDLIWKRMMQMIDASRSMRETFKVQVHGITDRGLLVTLSGLRGFVPIGHIPKPDGKWLEREDLEELYMGKSIEVTLMTGDPARNSFTCSLKDAATHRALRRIKIGTLVWGTVRIVRDYGVFVAMDDTFESALLHISNMSWERVEETGDLFTEGDRVRAVVIGMDDGYTRISISTKDIEKDPGDMLGDRTKVYADADESVKPFLAHVAEWEANEGARDEEQDWQSSGADAMEDGDFRS